MKPDFEESKRKGPKSTAETVTDTVEENRSDIKKHNPFKEILDNIKEIPQEKRHSNTI